MAALECHRKQGSGDAVRDVYNDIIRTGHKMKNVEGLIKRMQSIEKMREWNKRVDEIAERVRSQPPMPPGVQGGN